MITQFKQNQIVYVEMKRRREIVMGGQRRSSVYKNNKHMTRDIEVKFRTKKW